jgi:UDP-glucose 4-epimerase
MKVLVTGGRGFIGGHVCKLLDEHGFIPLVFDRRKIECDHETFLGDICNPVDVAEAFAHADAFIHLAGVLGTQETIQNPIPAATVNILGGLNVLQAAAQYGVPGVYIGVGNHWMDNAYSISKTTVERFVRMYNKDRGTCINIVRPVNAYGPGQVAAAPYGPSKVRKIIPSFICRALKNHPIELYGGGHQISDMVYVTDVAKTLIKAMEYAVNRDIMHDAIEVGPSKHNTVREVAEMIIRLTGSKSELVDLPMRPGEIPGAVVTADNNTLRHLGIDPDHLLPLEYGLQITIHDFRKRYG